MFYAVGMCGLLHMQSIAQQHGAVSLHVQNVMPSLLMLT